MINVLLVDDHGLVRMGLRGILEQATDICVVGEASDGEEAVRLVEIHKPDVILMDVSMPGIGGIEATRRIMQKDENYRIIALTGLEDEPFPSYLNEVGARGFLTKKCPAEEMIQAIRQVFQGGYYISSGVAQRHATDKWRRGADNPFKELSARESQVLMLILEGKRNQDISDMLFLSPKTVSTYRLRIFEKLSVSSEVELTRLAYRWGVLGEP